jgi:2-keto-4-pentenoate hydratase/2-oxohepta-3-ene-1,7-dioic acid hydratase in catechol pathway
VKDGWVIDLAAAELKLFPGSSHQGGFRSMRSLLEEGADGLARVRRIVEWVEVLPVDQEDDAVSGADETPLVRALDRVRLLAPIDDPRKVIGIGLNYRDHCEEQELAPPKNPVLFAKFASAVVGPDEAISWPPGLTSQVDLEAELAVIIGKRGRGIPVDRGLDYVAGYTIGNDVSARDLQFGDGQWVRGKSLDSFCPLGPWLVTADEVEDPHALRIQSGLNGFTMQDSNTRHLIFNVPFLVSFISRACTLCPGDVILTGTPAGVGVFREPPVFLQPGDTVEITIEGLGSLRNPVADMQGVRRETS